MSDGASGTAASWCEEGFVDVSGASSTRGDISGQPLSGTPADSFAGASLRRNPFCCTGVARSTSSSPSSRARRLRSAIARVKSLSSTATCAGGCTPKHLSHAARKHVLPWGGALASGFGDNKYYGDSRVPRRVTPHGNMQSTSKAETNADQYPCCTRAHAYYTSP
eukprot:scaffold31800_cov112-Isochrysis_galbana.AAC.5